MATHRMGLPGGNPDNSLPGNDPRGGWSNQTHRTPADIIELPIGVRMHRYFDFLLGVMRVFLENSIPVHIGPIPIIFDSLSLS